MEPAAENPDQRFFIVGVGASAGGLEALQRLFATARPTGGMAFVVVQHLSPDFDSVMGQLLAPHTALTVKRVDQGMLVEPDHVYLMPPKHEMLICDGRLHLTERDPAKGLFLPIDTFFRSLAEDAGGRSVGVVLSGTGSDGSRGIRAIHEAGGLIIAQDDSAKFDGMPRSAVDTGVVDLVLPPESIGDTLARYLDHDGHLADMDGGADRDVLTRIFDLLRLESGIDFTDYKASTVGRRIERRLLLTETGDLERYLDKIAADPAELRSLYKDLLIGVTRFLRDEEAFDKLASEVLPDLVAAVPPAEEMRLWVPGCATGEEPYSLAMLVAEAFRASGRSPRFRIFATDAHRASLEVASAGVYPVDAVERIPAQLRDLYFRPHRDGLQVSSDLRGHVVFAHHNVLRDAPFTRLDLLSCRNLLIYFMPAAQRRALSVFHFGLKTGGVLVMGPSESPGPFSEEFVALDSRWKIFRKHRDVRIPPDVRVNSGDRFEKSLMRLAATRQPPEDPRVVRSREALLEEYAPAALVVDQELRLVHSFNAASEYLVPKDGRPSLNVLDLLEGELRTVVSATVRRAQKDQTRAVFEGVQARTPQGTRRLRVTVRPIPAAGTGEDCWAISLEPETLPGQPQPAVEPPTDVDSLVKERVTGLEGELRFAKESLQATIEEMEASNEELQATNEELIASNEELQSTNEELHSVNEELYTVNREYQSKIAELTELTADMNHLLEATEVHTLFVDRDLRLRKFTPKIGEAFHLLPHDVGRRLDSFAHDIEDQRLLQDLERVLQTGVTVEREVLDRQGHPYFLRILSYRTGGVIDGVVLTLVDMSALKRAQRDLTVSEERYRTLMRAITAVMWTADAEGKFATAQSEWEEYTGQDWPAHQGHGWLAAIHPEDQERVKQAWRAAVDDPRSFETDGRIWSEAHRAYRYFLARAAPLLDDSGVPREWVGHIVDVHESKTAEMELRLRDEQIRAILDHSPTFIFLKDPSGKYLLAGRQCEMVLGVACDEVVGKTDYDLLPISIADGRRASERKVLESGQTVEVEEVVFRGDEARTFLTSLFPLRDSHGDTYAFAGVSTDITERKRAGEEAQEAVERRDRFLAMLSHELRTPLGAIVNATEILSRNEISAPCTTAAQVIGRQARHMGRLIDDLLDVGRITREQIVIDSKPVDLIAVLDEALDTLRPEAERKGVTLSSRSAEEDLVVRGDPVRLRQILTNLLANAITHTAAGSVEAIVERAGEAGEKVRVRISDTGVGIPPEQLPRIFELFYQAPQPLDRPRGGLGVGLNLAQTLARLHGGEISARSDGAGKGSTFTLTLPLATGRPERPPEATVRGQGALRIVVVEDNDDNRLTFEELLRSEGHDVQSARDGLDGVDLILREKPDVAFVDVGLPGLDGFSVARRVRETGPISVRLVALTGYGMPEDQARAVEAGFDRHMLKPLDVSALTHLLAELAGGKRRGN
jgi:two-component system, chemotaxis family, CheB/CheR fusion protein